MIKKLQNSNWEIAEKIRSIFTTSYAIEAEILNAKDFPPLKRELKSYINCKNIFFGYFVDNEIAGIVEIDKEIDNIHIQSLVVHPDFFKQGIASKLITFILNSFSVTLFTVETGVKNIPACNLYTKHNFIEVKQWDTDHGVRKVRFERRY